MKMPVKICGITNIDDAQAALAAGADALGFIFSSSARQIEPELARSIIAQLPQFTTTVGVFVNEPFRRIQEIIRYCGLSVVQLQGNESNDFCQQFEIPVIKAFHIDDSVDSDMINSYRVAAFLLDTYVPGQNGGTGKTFDWRLLQNKTFTRPLIVSGGLHAGNIRQLLGQYRPSAVDVSSGVAHSAQRKDPTKIQSFMAAVANAQSITGADDSGVQKDDILKACFDQQPLVEIQGRKFLLNALTEQIPATPAALLYSAAKRICDTAHFLPGTKLAGEEDKGGGLLAAVSLLSGLPYGIARWYPSGLEGQVRVNFDCEYTAGSMYLNGIDAGDNVYIVDDLISTGGTLIGLVEAIRLAGANVLGIICVAEKINYGGADRVRQATGITVNSLVQVDLTRDTSTVTAINY